MLRNGCYSFKVGPGEGEALGLLGGLFSKPHSQVSVVPCGTSLDKNVLPLSLALETVMAILHQFFFLELFSLVLIRDQREQSTGDESAGDWWDSEGLLWPGPIPQNSQTERKDTKSTSFICCEEGTHTRDSPVSHVLPELLCEPFGFFSFPETGAGAIFFLPTIWPAIVGFFLSLEFWGVLFWCVCG